MKGLHVTNSRVPIPFVILPMVCIPPKGTFSGAKHFQTVV